MNMQDIRPVPKRPFDNSSGKPENGMPLPAADELYEVSRAPKQRRLAGSSVPVANVHVPFDQAQGKPVGEDKPRPLFAKAPVPAPRKARHMRLGQRERMAVLVLLAIIVAVGLLGALIFLPRADIKLTLRTAPLLVDQELIVRAQGTESPNAVPGAGFFREVPVAGAIPVVSTEVVGSKATGPVEIVNKTSEEQRVKERSRLVTNDGVLFYMVGPAFVPGNGRTTVTVEAAESGEAGNVTAGRLNFAALDPSAQSVVYGEVTQPLKGGTGEEVHVVREEDINRARVAAQEEAEGKVRDEIQAELPRGWTLLDESWAAELSDFTSDGEVGSRQPQLGYKGQATVRVLGYETATLEERLTTALKSRLDREYALFPGPISFSKTVKSVDWEKGEGVISARVTHTTIPDFSPETLRQKIARRNRDEAKQYLEGLPGVQSVELTLSPFWVQSIPRIEKRINLELVPERQP